MLRSNKSRRRLMNMKLLALSSLVVATYVAPARADEWVAARGRPCFSVCYDGFGNGPRTFGPAVGGPFVCAADVGRSLKRVGTNFYTDHYCWVPTLSMASAHKSNYWCLCR